MSFPRTLISSQLPSPEFRNSLIPAANRRNFHRNFSNLSSNLFSDSSSLSTMRTGPLFYAACEDYNLHEPHFLDACSLCRKPLGQNSDIFMYRGNTPFCSKECRQEQIEMDEAEEKNWRRSSSSSSSSSSNSKSLRKPEANKKTVRSGTVAVA